MRGEMEWSGLTCVDQIEVINSGVIHIMDGACKQSGEDLQISKHSLRQHEKERDCKYTSVSQKFYRTCTFLVFIVTTSRAGVDSRTCVDWTTSAAWMLLW